MASSAVVAKRYARALILSAGTPAEAASWLAPLEGLAETVKGSTELTKLLSSPAFSEQDKWNVVSEILTQLKAPKEVANFVRIIVDAKRAAALTEIGDTYKTLMLAHQNTVEAQVETASELSDSEKLKIQELLEKALGKKVQLSVKLEPSLLAGFRVEVAGFTMDASLQSNIETIHKNLLRADFSGKGVRAEA